MLSWKQVFDLALDQITEPVCFEKIKRISTFQKPIEGGVKTSN
jgi:hypothetical protein